MTDQDKTREQLLEEVRSLRDRLALLQDGAARQRQAEERFATTFRASPVGISLSTLADGRFVDVNDSFLRLLGRPRDEVIGRTSVELGMWGDAAHRPSVIETLQRQGSLRDLEVTFPGPDGQRHCLVSADLVQLEAGPHLLGMYLDVTARRRAEQALRDSEERHRLISELTSDYAYTCRVDADGTVAMESVTEGFQKVLGYTLEEVQARGGWASIIHPDDLAAVWERMPRLLAGESDVYELRVVTRAGATRWIRYSTRPVRDAALGRVARLLGGVHDVTERRRAEEALRESEARFRAFMANSPAVAWMKDHRLRYAYVSGSWERYFRKGLAEVRGRSDLDVWPPAVAERLREHDRAVLACGRAMEFEEEVPDPAGRPRHWQVYKFPFRDAAGTSYVGGVAVDITARREAEGQLRAYARRLLEVQEQERRHLARELHDEVGQTLTGLKLGLERCAGLASGAVREALEESSGLLRELTQRVRDLSLRLRPTMLDDLGLLPALLWHGERYTAQTGVRVSFERGPLPERLPAAVETAAYRVVQEALTNVARHAGVREAVVRLWVDGGWLGLQVEDRGVGFDPHAVAGPSAGLSGMRDRARLLGGRLEVESAPGQGTRVTAELPLVEARPGPDTGPLPEA
jgi:PAS domain S-box-containing protein